MMTLSIRWRKALMISLFSHLLLLSLSGYLTAQLFTTPPPVEQVIELDLSSEIQAPAPPAQISEPQPQTASMPQPAPDTPSAQQAIPAPVVASADTMSVISAEATEASIASPTSTTSAPVSSPVGSSGLIRNVAPPRILAKTEPVYPKPAQQAAQQGTVVLKVQILENGRPGDISIASSSGHELLDNAAIAAVTKWRFVPAKDKQSGQAVACYSRLPVSFRLN
jgi:protein TonB